MHVPFSGGLYGKRKADSFGSKKSQMIPFSGGFYGKRAMLYDDFDDIYGKKKFKIHLITESSC